MQLNLTPVKVDISIETTSLAREAFYNICFITENNTAPRTIEVESLAELLDNGYSRLDLAYNFCVGVFAQQGIPFVFIRAKRTDETYLQAYTSDSNEDFYFIVIQSKKTEDILELNSHLVNNSEDKLQFYSRKLIPSSSSHLVNYFQDFTPPIEGVVEGSKDYYLNKAYLGVGKAVIPDVPVDDFDFAVIRYKWNEAGGRDLNTRTYISSPDRSDYMVGWSRSDNDLQYLFWNGDNVRSGVESVLLDIKAVSSDYPNQESISVDLRAFWYQEMLGGNLAIEFASCKGGAMVKSGFDWVNDGGDVVQTLTLNTRTQNQNRYDDGELLVKLDFNLVSKTGSLTKAAPPTNKFPTVSIWGGTRVGDALNISTIRGVDVTVTPSDATYQWLSNGVLVGSSEEYILASSDVGNTISIIVSFLDSYGVSQAATDTYRREIRVAVTSPVPVPTPDATDPPASGVCLPSTLTVTMLVANPIPRYITMSRNGGTAIRYEFDIGDGGNEAVGNYYKLMYLDEDGVSYAFVNNTALGIEPNSYDDDTAEVSLSGISVLGIAAIDSMGYNLLETGVFTIESFVAPLRVKELIPKKNTLTIFPTTGVPIADDQYYMYGGDESGKPIVITSCAKAVLK